MADYNDRWEIIDDLGKGGQGTVHRVRDKQRCESREKIRKTLVRYIPKFGSVTSESEDKDSADAIIDAILDIVRGERIENHAALKILNTGQEARDARNGPTRLIREIKGMASLSHPGLLRIIEADPENDWFVSELHENGTLLQRQKEFTGNPDASLTAIRPLIAAVAEIHKENMVHRDIKADNIFVANDKRLVLGDFGLVFFCDDAESRLTNTLSNVGSWQWMPAWAQSVMVENLTPAFDVFCLGKVLWWMISGMPIEKLKLWYIDDTDIDIEKLFPNAKFIWLVKHILKKCVVERENKCLPDASALLETIDGALSLLENRAELLSANVSRTCSVCGYGQYAPLADRDQEKTVSFGLSPESSRLFKIFQCNWCGHVQLFSFTGGPTEMPGWQGLIQI